MGPPAEQLRCSSISLGGCCSPCHTVAACLDDLTPTQQRELYDLASHTESGNVNYVRLPAEQLLHNPPCSGRSIGFGVNAGLIEKGTGTGFRKYNFKVEKIWCCFNATWITVNTLLCSSMQTKRGC